MLNNAASLPILALSSPRDESVSPRRPDKGLLDPPGALQRGVL